MKKAYDLAQKIIDGINDYSEHYVTSFGKTIHTEEQLMALNMILENGFTLYNYIVKHEFYEGKPEILTACNEVAKYLEKLEINEENAKKLQMSSALQVWEQARLAIAMLACTLLDYRDSLN